MTYIYDPELVELFGERCAEARALDSNDRPLMTPHRQTGLWCNADVPKKGWRCVGIRKNATFHDPAGPAGPGCQCYTCITLAAAGKPKLIGWVDEPPRQCEMCEVTWIKYIHTMFHPDYPEKLECGCDCAGIMQQNKEAAQRFEKYAKAVARARKVHAAALRTISLSASNALTRSTWDDSKWLEAGDWAALVNPKGGWFTPSTMILEGVGDYWLGISRRRGPDRYRGHCGLRWWDGYRNRRTKGLTSPMTFATVADAKAWAVRKMVELWRRRIDSDLAEVEGRNRVVNSFGDVVVLG